MSFSNFSLDANIQKAILACGYTNPTPVQAEAIPAILKRQDVVVSAQTGTGKTAAFTLPALHQLSLAPSKNKPRVLILTPTRELAAQVTKAAATYGKFMRFSIISLVGGMPYRQQLKDLSRSVDIVVATPGRLLDHIENRKIDLSQVEMFILDEADRMLDMGFIDDVKTIASKLPQNRQTLLFSATIDKNLTKIISQLLKNPTSIAIEPRKDQPSLITQTLYLADNHQHKDRLLTHFLDNGNMFKAIIFSATKINADKLAGELNYQGYQAAAIHGDLKQNVRNRTLEALRRGKIQFLVATDVAARGIDIADITHVINYDIPKFAEDYVHRIGRTGRAGKTGVAITFALQSDVRHIQNIERYTKQRMEMAVVEGLEPVKRLHASPAGSPKSKGRGGYDRKPNASGHSKPRRFGDKDNYASKSSEFGAKRFSDRNANGKPAFSGEKKPWGKPDFSAEKNTRSRSEFSGDRNPRGRSEFSGDRSSSSRPSFSGDRNARGRSEFSGDRNSSSRSSFSGDRNPRGRSEFSGDRNSGSRSSFSGDRNARGKSEFSGDRNSGSRPSFSGDRNARGRSEFSGDRNSGSRSSFSGDRNARGKSEFSGDRSARGKSDFGADRNTRSKPAFSSDRGAQGKPSFSSDKPKFASKKPSSFGKKDRKPGAAEPFQAAKKKKPATTTRREYF